MPVTFTYRGISSASKGIDILNLKRDLFPTITARLMTVSSRSGAYYFGSRMDPREIEVEILLQGSSLTDFRNKVRDLASWLQPDGGVADLSFDDEPDKVYRAVVSGDSEFEQIRAFGKGKLVFLCPDPFAYSTTQEIQNLFMNIVTRVGSAPSFPMFDITFKVSASEFKVLHAESGKYVRVVRSFAANDRLQIDCDKRQVTLNGATIMNALDITSQFFPLLAGNNTIEVPPSATADVICTYTPRWY
ncbi:distal tail protein Dit [Effusibacillus pohliae]|uniref:distal tail protein Dit n=1 Tax=Effusibacillus pohliae TaxID=232270 RepID=UPI00036AA8AB|nr:distal tail protein Dit [Effusibacillus pohliae]